MGITDTTPSEPDRSNREQRTRQPLNPPPPLVEIRPPLLSVPSVMPSRIMPDPWSSSSAGTMAIMPPKDMPELRETRDETYPLSPSSPASSRSQPPLPNPQPQRKPHRLVTHTPPHLSTCHKCLTPHHQKTHANISPHQLLCGPDTRLPSLLLHRHPITPTAKKKNNRLLLFIYARPPPPHAMPPMPPMPPAASLLKATSPRPPKNAAHAC